MSLHLRLWAAILAALFFSIASSIVHSAPSVSWRIKEREGGCASFSKFFEGELRVPDTLTPQQLIVEVRTKWPTARLSTALKYFDATRQPGDVATKQHPWGKHFTKTNVYIINIDDDLEFPIFNESLCKTLGIPLQ